MEFGNGGGQVSGRGGVMIGESVPLGSLLFAGLLPAYVYRLIPPSNPIGSLVKNLPIFGS